MIDLHSIADIKLLRESVDLECKLAAGRDVSAGDSKCTTSGRIKVHHFGRGVSLSGIG
jgi:hypothetical protein